LCSPGAESQFFLFFYSILCRFLSFFFKKFFFPFFPVFWLVFTDFYFSLPNFAPFSSYFVNNLHFFQCVFFVNNKNRLREKIWLITILKMFFFSVNYFILWWQKIMWNCEYDKEIF
jgi:hypothetical protein